MPGTLRSSWIWLDLSYHAAVADVGAVIVAGAAPVAGTVKSVVVGINTLLTTGGGTVAVGKGSASLISSATYNLGSAASPDLVAATPEAATLTTATSSLKVAQYDLLKATWTLTTVAVGNSGVCLVAIEPDEW